MLCAHTAEQIHDGYIMTEDGSVFLYNPYAMKLLGKIHLFWLTYYVSGARASGLVECMHCAHAAEQIPGGYISSERWQDFL